MLAVNRPATCGRRNCGEQGRIRDAKASFLALHVAARLSGSRALRNGGWIERVTLRLGPIGDRDPAQKQNRHRGPYSPSMSRRSRHAAEGIGQACGNGEDAEHLNQIRKRSGIFKQVRAVGTEEAATVRSPLLNDFLRSNRTLRNSLSGDGVHHRLTAGVHYWLAILTDTLHLLGLHQL